MPAQQKPEAFTKFSLPQQKCGGTNATDYGCSGVGERCWDDGARWHRAERPPTPMPCEVCSPTAREDRGGRDCGNQVLKLLA